MFFPTFSYSQLGKGYTAVHASGFRDFLLKPELLSAIRDCAFEHPSEGGSADTQFVRADLPTLTSRRMLHYPMVLFVTAGGNGGAVHGD